MNEADVQDNIVPNINTDNDKDLYYKNTVPAAANTVETHTESRAYVFPKSIKWVGSVIGVLLLLGAGWYGFNYSKINTKALTNQGNNLVNCGLVAQQGDWIYYTNTNYVNGSNFSIGTPLYKIRTDGSERTLLSDDDPYSINVAGDWVYYRIMGSSSDGSIYRIKNDGSGRELVQ